MEALRFGGHYLRFACGGPALGLLRFFAAIPASLRVVYPAHFSVAATMRMDWGSRASSFQLHRYGLTFAVHLTHWQWACLAVAAFCSGLSKTGILGLSILPVALFANVLPARESTGAILPLLLCGDVFGVMFFRKHASWPHLWRLSAWVMAGVVIGFCALGRVNNAQMQRMIGIILLAMLALHGWRGRQAGDPAGRLPHSWWFAALMGFLAGFTTMVANAAGPVMVLYFLAIGLPKLVFIGTAAWFFMLVNAFKVPFSVKLGLITPESLLMDAILLLPMIPGALLGPRIVHHINQRAFEKMVLLLNLAAVVRLLW